MFFMESHYPTNKNLDQNEMILNIFAENYVPDYQKAFRKSMNINKPGIFYSAVKSIIVEY